MGKSQQVSLVGSLKHITSSYGKPAQFCDIQLLQLTSELPLDTSTYSSRRNALQTVLAACNSH